MVLSLGKVKGTVGWATCNNDLVLEKFRSRSRLAQAMPFSFALELYHRELVAM